MADPFYWKPDDVAQFLCSSSIEVTEDPEALTSRIRDGRLNGRRLLTFGIALTDQQLQEHLGLTEAWQQLELAEAISELRCQSPAFQEWEARRNAGESTLKLKNQASPIITAPRPSKKEAKIATSEPRSHATEHNGTVPDDPPLARAGSSHLQEESIGTAAGQGRQNAHDSTKRLRLASEATTANIAAEANEARPAKRRAVLVNISSETGTAPQPSFNTEEDHFSTETQALANVVNWKLLESAGPSAYLGEGTLRPDDIWSTTMTLSSRCVENPYGEGENDGSFVVPVPNQFAPGLRLVVYRNTKRLFMENNRSLSLLAAGLKPLSRREGSIGLEDLPSDYDDQTKKEIAAELQERALELERNKDLTEQEVAALMNEAVAKINANWQETKRLKNERRAFKIWTAASRRKTRELEIGKAMRQIVHLNSRLMRMQRDIAALTWKNRGDVLRQCLSFEATVEDRCYQDWLVSMLSSRSAPPRPEQLPRPRRAPKPKPDEDLSEGEEILMSSDEEDNFIVDDMEEASAQLQQDVEDAAARDQREPSIMDLTITPQKPKFIDLTTSPAGDRQEEPALANGSRQLPGRGSQILITPEFVRQAKEHEPKKFGKMHGKTGMLLSLLWKLDHSFRVQVFTKANETNMDSIWTDTIETYLARAVDLPSSGDPQAHCGGLQPETLQVAFEMSRLFLMYWRKHHYPDSKLIPAIKRRLSNAQKDLSVKNHFKAFLRIIQQAAPHFLNDSLVYRREALLQDSDEEFADDQPADASQSRRRIGAAVEVVQDKNAVDLREREARRNAELQAARERFWKNIAASDAVPADRTQHIINEGKQDHQGLIYINEVIGKRIKPHQIDGVRFLWNQIVQDANGRQGCLLAHTMGLGKTMQVITFLVALHESANSDDPTVREQVPRDLRQNPTLIMSPAGLVDNWMEELKNWAPLETLNPLRKVSSDMTPEERHFTLEQWAETGGVLVIGYEMLKQLFNMSEQSAELLMKTPTTVVADEAHRLKNSVSKLHTVCSQFETKARIALTGSPLANNVEEYYHMIDWVAPNFLGPPQEFKDIYSKDIEAGLYHDSIGIQKRQAIKMLQVLKETVAPKVHRATITALKDDLPNKHEFVISVAPTTFQKNLYNACVQVIKNNAGDLRQSQIFAVLGILSLVCNHPKCLHVRVKDVKEKERDAAGVFSSALIGTVLMMSRGMDIDDPSLSSKMTLLTRILDQARASGDKVLIFTTSIPTLQYLQHVLIQQKRKVAVLDGSTSISKRQTNVKSFNEGQKEVYVISTKAGGVGLNIQGANRVVLFDFKWNPMDEQQAIGRAYRIGQEKTVFVYRFVLAGTFEEDLHNKAVFKTQLASRVVDKKNPISWSKRGGQLVHDVKDTAETDLAPFLGKDEVLDQIINGDKGLVRSIMSTDAFEEEDHTAALTAAELKETDQLVHMNRLRTTDPVAYQREMERQRVAAASNTASSSSGPAQSHIPTPTQGMDRSYGTSIPPPAPEAPPVDTFPNISQSMDGASDFPFVRSKTTGGVFGLSSTRGPPKLRYHATGPERDLDIPTPTPMTGANTYFGQHPSPAPPKSLSPERAVGQAPLAPGRAFGQAPFQTNTSRAKSDFERSFAKKAHDLRANWLRPNFFSQATIDGIVNEIDQLRRSKGLGFLPDDLQWKCLKDQVENSRFTAAAAFGRFTPQWLAFSNRQDMKARLDTLDEMSEAEFARFLDGGGNATDPMNLDNIRRPNLNAPGTPRSVHAQEDMKAMRAAADRRRARNSSLPSWALDALPTTNR